jgi:hypothetical protein
LQFPIVLAHWFRNWQARCKVREHFFCHTAWVHRESPALAKVGSVELGDIESSPANVSRGSQDEKLSEHEGEN